MQLRKRLTGASVVSSEYMKLMEEGKMVNIIETCCPVIVTLVQTYFPNLISQLAPIDSPMIVHGKLLKKKYPDAKVVFLKSLYCKGEGGKR